MHTEILGANKALQDIVAKSGYRYRLGEIVRTVSLATAVETEMIISPKQLNRVRRDARDLVIVVSVENRVIHAGQLQDFLMCSNKDIQNARSRLTDASFAEKASAIWDTFHRVHAAR